MKAPRLLPSPEMTPERYRGLRGVVRYIAGRPEHHNKRDPVGMNYSRGLAPPEWGVCRWCGLSVGRKRGRARRWHRSCYVWFRIGRGQIISTGETALPFGAVEFSHSHCDDHPESEGAAWCAREICQGCGKPSPGRLELDHIMAIALAHRLGEFFYRRAFSPTNLWWICRDCHLAKTKFDRMCMRRLDENWKDRKWLAGLEAPRRLDGEMGVQATFAIEEECALLRDGGVMKAITLYQPWASLIAEGVKTIETRGRPAPQRFVGTRIAIHAAKRNPEGLIYSRGRNGFLIGYDLSLYGPIRHMVIGRPKPALPTGAVLATARLKALAQVLECDGDTARVRQGSDESIFVKTDPYGDFSPGRWLWMLDEVRKLAEPIPARGRQWFWEWDSVLDSSGALVRAT